MSSVGLNIVLAAFALGFIALIADFIVEGVLLRRGPGNVALSSAALMIVSGAALVAMVWSR